MDGNRHESSLPWCHHRKIYGSKKAKQITVHTPCRAIYCGRDEGSINLGCYIVADVYSMAGEYWEPGAAHILQPPWVGDLRTQEARSCTAQEFLCRIRTPWEHLYGFPHLLRCAPRISRVCFTSPEHPQGTPQRSQRHISANRENWAGTPRA